MGDAKKRMEVRVNLAEIQRQRAEFAKTIPMRIVKGIVGFLGFIPITMIAFAAVCFQKNEWPWSQNL